MMTRRMQLIALSVAPLLAALPSLAQQQQRHVRRIGFLSGGTAQTNAQRLVLFRESIAGLGWVEGRDYIFDARYGEGV